MRTERINMRALAEFSLLAGDLYADGMNLSRIREGIINHRALQCRYEGGMKAEAPLEMKVSTGTCELIISGRADGLLIGRDLITIEEIKSSQGRVRPDGYPVHWAQAEGYALMACLEYGLEQAEVSLVYVHALSGRSNETRITRRLALAELKRDFDRVLKPYADWLDDRTRFEDARDESIKKLVFPFPDYREGQKKMAVRVYRAMLERHNLLMEAPTGIGKTVGTLFPAIKALGRGCIGKVLYLTAKRTASRAAWDCMRLLARSGLRARVCMLTAKAQSCLTPGARCVPDACPYCAGYFDKRRAALSEARAAYAYDAEFIETLARKYGICPFELSLDISEMADVIICDYNYVFDPNVCLRRYFASKSDFGLLIDEAHNLEARARDMLSAGIRFQDYVTLYRHVNAQLGPQSAECLRLVELMRAWRAFGAGRTGESFEAVKPEALIRACESFTDATSPVLSAGAECSGEWAELWFALMDFAKVGSMYSPDSYSTICSIHDGGADVTQLCVDASGHIRSCIAKARASIMFSATLSPVKYYFKALGLDESRGDDMLELPSPFLSENFLVRRLAIPTRYAQRAPSLAPIAKVIHSLAASHTGSYIACFPSYAYLHDACAEFRREFPDVEVIEQRQNMDDRARAKFLSRFLEKPERSMVGFIAMGGAFSESIDLPGERLSGAVIVGVALPQMSPVREALRAHFEAGQGEGFNYAYVYPGICRVLQAAGRVIRTEDDAGVALLVDDRFFREPYASLFPAHWNVASAEPEELDGLLRRFWRGEAY